MKGKIMTKEDHEFRRWINPLLKNEIEKTELEFGDIIRGLTFDKKWLKNAVDEWVLKKTIERLIKQRTNKIKVYDFAKEKHKGQKDDEGKNYFKAHVFKVAKAVSKLTEDKEIISAAFLHDVLEDTETTYEELIEKFGKRTADLVDELTCQGKKDEYGYYFPKLKSKDAIMIKLIDRASNISRMNNWDEKRKEHYLKKTKFWKDGSDLK